MHLEIDSKSEEARNEMIKITKYLVFLLDGHLPYRGRGGRYRSRFYLQPFADQ